MLNKKKIGVIGSGFAGISSAATLGQLGYDVHVFEKNEDIGGRARQFKAQGFTFDMGPSWYWMPDVIEKFFQRFDTSVHDHIQLKQLDPGFQMIFSGHETVSIPKDYEELQELFENIETGSADKLNKFMREAEYKYQVGVNDLVYQPGLSFTELMRPEIVQGIFKLQLFASFSKHIRKYFSNHKLIALMEFPVLFLGAMPAKTPALYSLMNYTGLKQGTFYPEGGFGVLIQAMKSIAEANGSAFHTESPVTGLEVNQKSITRVLANGHSMNVDGIIGAADYQHIEAKLLPEEHRNYSPNYWDKKVFAPSSLIFYLGVSTKVDKLIHHNLFFDEDLDQHAHEIYESKEWPTKPLFYVCCPSKTDSSVAPEGGENLFVLMPIAPGLEDTAEIRDEYYDVLMKRLEKYTGTAIREHVVYKRDYCVQDFKQDYNAYKGNAYGLANTLMQTANLKPKLKSKTLDNMFFAGQLTVPGPGVPPSIISGQVAASEIHKHLSR